MSRHFAEKDMCPNVLPYAEACPHQASAHGRTFGTFIWTPVHFDEMIPTVKLQSLMCRLILPKRTGVQNGDEIKR